MTLKRRIFLANTGMVLCSLLILLGGGALFLKTFEDEFLSVLGQNSILAEHTYEIQTELLHLDSYQGDWNRLSKAVAKYDYELYVSEDSGGQRVKRYSNVRRSEKECIEEIEQMPAVPGEVMLINLEGVTVVFNTLEDGIRVYACYYNSEDSFLGMDRGMFEMFMIVFITAGTLAVAALVLLSQFLTARLTKIILQPADELTQAAKRIADGNLNESISYTKEDEFFPVCAAFDEMQKHLKEGIENAAAYEKARTEMVSGISHDLRTPLTSMKAYLKGILDGVANTPEKQEKYVRISYQKTCDMERLLQKLFFFSKLETGNMPFFLKEAELNHWISTYLNEKKTEFMENQVQIEFVPDAEEHEVTLDTEQMRRVFDNLIENSRKYAGVEPLNMTIRISEEISAQTETAQSELVKPQNRESQNRESQNREPQNRVSAMQRMVKITVSDNGQGVPEEKLPHIFEQFYRGDEARNSKNDGSGLGLYVCRYIVEQHGGRIDAYNDNGLTVAIRLPVKERARQFGQKNCM